jgi:hypothetical protein
MINVQIGKEAFCVIAQIAKGTVDKGQDRTLTVVKLYSRNPDTDVLEFINEGVAIMNPLDTFNPRVGLHKAMASALSPLDIDVDDKRQFHDAVVSWLD